MGRQINFYLHPDDYIDFENSLMKTGDVVFLPYYHFTDKVSTVESTIPTDFEKAGLSVYVVRKQDFNQMRLKHIEKFGYWLIDDSTLPVLHYDFSRFRNEKIMRGRLYFQPSFINNDEWCDKSEDFVKWADNVIKAARSNLRRYKFDMGGWGFTEYVGKHALEWLDKMKEEKEIDDSTLVFP